MNFNSLLVLFLVISANAVILLGICFLGIKFSKINEIHLIRMKQYFYSMLSTVMISCVFPTVFATVLFVGLFFFYRYAIFKRDAFRLQGLYQAYDENKPITKFSRIFHTSQGEIGTIKIEKDYLYSFDRYLNNAVYLCIFYCTNETLGPETPILYGIEFFVAITALFVLIAKLIYNLSVSTPSSVFYLCPDLSYIPVVLIALLFYGLATFIFTTTL